jgi:hypothetical protein
VLGRDQRSEIRDQTSQAPARGRTRCFSDLRHLIFDLRSANTAPPMLAHRLYAYPCPGPISSPLTRREMMTGPASRSRLASRFHKSRGQMSDDRCQMAQELLEEPSPLLTLVLDI